MDDNATTRLGPVLLIVGGIAGLVGGATHGDLPEESGAAALQFVSDHPAYALVHLVSIFAALGWALGLSSWRPTGSTPSGRWLAGASGRVALAGVAVLAVQFSIDGIGMEALVALWQQPGANREVYETIALIAPDALVGTAFVWLILLYGITPLLAGASLNIVRSRLLGWVGIVIGGFAIISGLSLALRFNLVPDWAAFGGSIIGGNLWVICLGISLIWQHRTLPAGD